MAKYHAPPPPPDSASIRAKDLRNKPLAILPGEYREETSRRDDAPWRYVECEVLLLGADGIAQRADGVRISWTRAVRQLRDFAAEFPGDWMPCRPVEDGNAVVLEELEGADLEAVERVLDELG
jgi:hypothetical protein